MSETVSDNLTATIRTVMLWNRVDEKEIGAITSAKTVLHTYQIADGADAGQADLVFADTRTIAANTVEIIDLSDIEQTSFGVPVPFHFSQIRFFRVKNTSTTSGRRLLVGASAGAPTTVYAAEVGPASDWFAINYQDHWEVTEDNKLFRIANPNAAAVTYELYILGSDVEPEE
jgi:hypothetical protein